MDPFSGQVAINRMEAGFSAAAQDLCEASKTARNGWVLFIALNTYLITCLTSVNHMTLLLSAPIKLPIIGIDVGLITFVIFAPIILLVVHFHLLMQHALLARKVRNLHDRVAKFEGKEHFRMHPVRAHLHSYFYTQLIAGPFKSMFLRLLLLLTSWSTLTLLPLTVLLGFQIAFLPFHDMDITWLHRAYVIADLLIIVIVGIFIRFPEKGFVTGFGASLILAPLNTLTMLVVGLATLSFSLAIATIPDEPMDRVMASLWPMPIPKAEGDTRQERTAFKPTAILFEGKVDALTGQLSSPFSRNIVVTDTVLNPTGKGAIRLRKRDLRYGIFDRTDMHQVDLIAAVLNGASFRETNLANARFDWADVQNADFWAAQLGSAKFYHSDLRHSVFVYAILDSADMRDADLGEVEWDGASLKSAVLTNARNLVKEKLSEEQLAEGKF